MIRRLLILLVSGCGSQVERFTGPIYERQRARESLNQADAIAVGVMGKPGEGYREGGDIYTDYPFRVAQGENVPVGESIIIKQRGGSVLDPGTGQRTKFTWCSRRGFRPSSALRTAFTCPYWSDFADIRETPSLTARRLPVRCGPVPTGDLSSKGTIRHCSASSSSRPKAVKTAVLPWIQWYRG